MIKLELDYQRMMEYQKLTINLNAVAEYFRHGDILLREVNVLLQNVKDSIDNNLETSFTKDDFDDMLTLRNTVLTPIFQNASFAVEFTPYIINVPETTTTTLAPPDIINDNITTTTTTVII